MTRSEIAEKNGFEAIGLVHGFCIEAARYGLTPTMLQRLRENSVLMREFVCLARKAQEEHRDRLAEMQLENERAVDSGGMHYHLVVIPKTHLFDYKWEPHELISDAVAHERGKHNWPLKLASVGKVVKLLLTINTCGQWIASTAHGGVLVWERTTEGVELIFSGLIAEFPGEGLRFNNFPNLLGMVFMHECPDCEHQDLPKK